MSYKEIAEQLGVSVTYAQNAVKRAVLRLREMRAVNLESQSRHWSSVT